MMLFKHIEMKDGLCRLCGIVLPCFEFFLGPTAAILYVANMEQWNPFLMLDLDLSKNESWIELAKGLTLEWMFLSKGWRSTLFWHAGTS